MIPEKKQILFFRCDQPITGKPYQIHSEMRRGFSSRGGGGGRDILGYFDPGTTNTQIPSVHYDQSVIFFQSYLGQLLVFFQIFRQSQFNLFQTKSSAVFRLMTQFSCAVKIMNTPVLVYWPLFMAKPCPIISNNVFMRSLFHFYIAIKPWKVDKTSLPYSNKDAFQVNDNYPVL